MHEVVLEPMIAVAALADVGIGIGIGKRRACRRLALPKRLLCLLWRLPVREPWPFAVVVVVAVADVVAVGRHDVVGLQLGCPCFSICLTLTRWLLLLLLP